MNITGIIVFGILWFVFAYIYYGNKIKNKALDCIKIDKLPSHEFQDEQDYVPTKTAILFGHHFSSIAGAGPIVGPILAFSLFGWLPAVLWILIGSVFFGAVHDFSAMLVSVKNKGISIVEIAETAISKRASTIFAIFVWLTLTLVEAVFANLTASTVVDKPEIAIPTFGLIALAIIFGYFVIRKNMNLVTGTILALIILGFLIYLGEIFPIVASYDFWLILTFVYTFAAAILPVWLLLQPRDYLSMYILIISLLFGLVGILILHPSINSPAFISFNSKSGPIFPILFIIIACGAISGFHSIIASGTTAKQLDKIPDAKKIGFGGMLVEALLALLVVMMVASVLQWEGNGQFSFHDLLKKSPNIAFGTAYGSTLAVFGIPMFLGTSFGVLMLNAFILTSLDTSARLNRYIVQETLGSRYKGIFKNKYFATSSSLVLALILCMSNGFKSLWPMFGASNQLIAALTLFVVSAYISGFKAPLRYTLIPAVLMLIITEAALFYQAVFTHFPTGNWVLFTLSVILFISGLIVTIEASKKLLINLKIIKS